LLAAWVLVLIVTQSLAPPFDEVARDREFAFLPADAPSRRAEEVYRKAFPDDNFSSNIVLVLHSDRADREHRDRDLKFIENVLEPALPDCPGPGWPGGTTGFFGRTAFLV